MPCFLSQEVQNILSNENETATDHTHLCVIQSLNDLSQEKEKVDKFLN